MATDADDDPVTVDPSTPDRLSPVMAFARCGRAILGRRGSLDLYLFPLALGSALGVEVSREISEISGRLATGIVIVVIAAAVVLGLIFPRPQRAPTRRQQLAQVGVVLVVAALVAGTLRVAQPPLDRFADVDVIAGSYPIGVVELAIEEGGTENEHDRVESTVAAFQQNLVAGLASGADGSAGAAAVAFDIEVNEIQDVELLSELAQRSSSRALIIGTARTLGSRITVESFLFVTGEGLLGAEELAGLHPLVAIQDDLAQNGAQGRLTAAAQARTTEISVFVSALMKLDEGAATSAYEDLSAATYSDPGLEAVAQVLLGNIAGTLARYDDAEDHYAAAAQHPDTASRAGLGQAQVMFAASLGLAGDCTGLWDRDGVEAAKRLYEKQRSGPSPAGANVSEKATFGAARAEACISQGDGRPVADTTIASLDAIVDAHLTAPFDSDLRELASESHAVAAGALAPSADSSAEREAVLARYDDSLELTRQPQRLIASRLDKLIWMGQWSYPTSDICVEVELLDKHDFELVGVLAKSRPTGADCR